MTISILGCGWLGLPLAKYLVNKGYNVKGSTTRQDKLPLLQEAGIMAHHVSVTKSGILGDAKGLLDCDVLYINLPPGRRSYEELESYPGKITSILKLLSKETKVIFVSSTGVYADVNGIVTENNDITPSRSTGVILRDSERIVMNMMGSWIILRMAGLVGPDRNPGRWFSGKKDIPNGSAPVNLVHRDDCIAISERILTSDIDNEIFNVCSDEHPTRMDFYGLMATKQGLEPPTFIKGRDHYKIVSNQKIRSQLGYDFIHPSPMEMSFT